MSGRNNRGAAVFTPTDRGALMVWTKTERTLMEQLDITGDMTSEFRSQGALFARWGFIKARADAEAEALMEELSILEAELARAYRRKAPRTVKEGQVKEFVKTRPVRRRLVKELQEAQWRVRVLKIAVDAFDHRRSMLMMLGADRRKEWGSTDMRTKQRRASEIIKEAAMKRKPLNPR